MRNLINRLVTPLMDWLRGRDIDEREKQWQLDQEKLEQENTFQEAEGCSSCGDCGCK